MARAMTNGIVSRARSCTTPGAYPAGSREEKRQCERHELVARHGEGISASVHGDVREPGSLDQVPQARWREPPIVVWDEVPACGERHRQEQSSAGAKRAVCLREKSGRFENVFECLCAKHNV